jgi:TRAP-type C4-dicarboxylate transport system permease small subunit
MRRVRPDMSNSDSRRGSGPSDPSAGSGEYIGTIRIYTYRIFDNTASVFLFVLMMVTVGNALGRYLIQEPLAGTITFVEIYLMIGIIWFSVIPLQLNEDNIKLDIFSDNFGELLQSVIKSLYLSAIAVVLIFTLRGVFDDMMQLWEARATTTGTVQFPTYVSWGLLTLGLAVLCAVLIDQSVRYLSKTVRLIRRRTE